MAAFTRDKIRQEADKTFSALDLSDAPNGVLKLRSILRVGKDAQERIKAHQKRMRDIEKNEDADVEDVRGILVDLLAEVADRTDDWYAYAEDFDLAELLQLYTIWQRETQAGEATPPKR